MFPRLVSYTTVGMVYVSVHTPVEHTPLHPHAGGCWADTTKWRLEFGPRALCLPPVLRTETSVSSVQQTTGAGGQRKLVRTPRATAGRRTWLALPCAADKGVSS